MATLRATGAPAATLTSISRVYGHEPNPGEIAKPASVTILTVGVTPEFFRFQLRIYCADGTQDITQARLDSAIDQVDAILEGRSAALQEVVKAASEEEFVEVEGDQGQ